MSLNSTGADNEAVASSDENVAVAPASLESLFRNGTAALQARTANLLGSKSLVTKQYSSVKPAAQNTSERRKANRDGDDDKNKEREGGEEEASASLQLGLNSVALTAITRAKNLDTATKTKATAQADMIAQFKQATDELGWDRVTYFTPHRDPEKVAAEQEARKARWEEERRRKREEEEQRMDGRSGMVGVKRRRNNGAKVGEGHGKGEMDVDAADAREGEGNATAATIAGKKRRKFTRNETPRVHPAVLAAEMSIREQKSGAVQDEEPRKENENDELGGADAEMDVGNTDTSQDVAAQTTETKTRRRRGTKGKKKNKKKKRKRNSGGTTTEGR